MLDPAFAYLDPGTGATLMQLFLAGAAGIGAAFKMRFRRGKIADDNAATEPAADHPPIGVEDSDPAA